MKTKLKLNDLKVTSFVTELNQNEVLTVKGGGFMYLNTKIFTKLEKCPATADAFGCTRDCIHDGGTTGPAPGTLIGDGLC